MGRHVYLIGMPGSGKSSVGRALAELLGVEFVDLDGEIERDAGRTIPEIFREEGEPRFRELEHEALARVAPGTRSVVSCGGGVPLREDNRLLLEETGTVVWLNVSLASLRRRIRDILDTRPLVKDPLDLERLYHQREETYRRVAHREVSAEGDPRAVAAAILEVLP
jgi:shikimate kinase